MEIGLDAWKRLLNVYTWDVNLSNFKFASEYPGHFNRVIRSQDVACFETLFRKAIEGRDSYQVAGEVCYWKNYGNHLSRDKITNALLKHLAVRESWGTFCKSVKEASTSPSFSSFLRLQSATDQPRGFATVLTFVSFYDPKSFPMVDKHIADWWKTNQRRFGLTAAVAFSQRDSDGWIETTTRIATEQNWNTYMAWVRFCRDYAQRLGGWRARDVEMAVWMAQKRGDFLPILPNIR
jgi:hypothetical protein